MSQDKMAAGEEKSPDDNDVPNVPATILSYKTIKEISLELCMVGSLNNWKDVADFLKFTNNEIEGHFANYGGCEPAQHMLNEWVFKRDGRLPELVKAFRELKLQSCLEELLADKEYQKASKYFSDHPDDDSGASSGAESSSEDSSLQPPTTIDNKSYGMDSSSMPTLGKHSLDTTDQSTLKENQECKKENKDFERKDNFKVKSEKTDKKLKEIPQKSPVDSIITLTDWPTYGRSNSVPGFEKDKIQVSRKFNRSKSEEKTKNKRTKVKKPKFFPKLSFRSRRKSPKPDCDVVVTVQGHHEEPKPSESTNLSPIKGGEVPESIDDACGRPISSSSEDSLPSSPQSQGYGSGLENTFDDSENKNKRIYIICNPGEPKIFSKAFELYQCFCKKGYHCNIFAVNFNEQLEIGVFRYQMEQFIGADHLFLCVSEELHKIFVEPCRNNPIKDDNSKSLRHVSDLMMGFLAKNCCNKNGKIMPILLTCNSRDHIPIFLEGYFAFEWPEQETRMENIIHRRPEFSIPVSHLREQAPQKVFGVKAVSP